jgi:hypothetical protein
MKYERKAMKKENERRLAVQVALVIERSIYKLASIFSVGPSLLTQSQFRYNLCICLAAQQFTVEFML